MRVLLIGLPHFCEQVAGFLSDHFGDSSRFVVIDTSTIRGQLRFMLHLARAHSVVRHWGTLTESRALTLSQLLRKRTVILWAGSDVLAAGEIAATGVEPKVAFLNHCIHACESPWTRDELAALGIRASLVRLLPLGDGTTSAEISGPTQFATLCYVGRDREDFYRLHDLARLAESYPEVPFRITGIAATRIALPPNVTLLGWTDEMANLYADSAVFIRLPVHDGCSFSVREALGLGRHVIASYPYAHCRFAPDFETLLKHFTELKKAYDEGRLKANWDGREYVLATYEPNAVAHELYALFTGR